MIEALGNSLLIIVIPGLPLSLGRLTFVIAGFIGLYATRTAVIKNAFFLSALFLFLGFLLATFNMIEGKEAVNKTMAFFLLFVGAVGVASYWDVKLLKHLLDTYFIAVFIYWTLVIIVKFLFDKDFGNYAESFKEGEVVNHHIPGMLLSISTAYISLRYFNEKSKLNIKGYILFFTTALICVLIGSRSNLVISIFILTIILFKNKFTVRRLVYITAPLMFLGFILIKGVVLQDDYLTKRFTVSDMNYQQRSSEMRIHYVNLALLEFKNNPFGKGLTDAEVIYKGRTQFVHNQYLTFILSGGILAILGIIFLFKGLWNIFRRLNFSSEIQKDDQIINACAISVITFFVILLTIESTGILFFIMFSLGIYSYQTQTMLTVVE